MSLVAYAASSDSEDSENEDGAASPTPVTNTPSKPATITRTSPTNGHISDEDDDYVVEQPSTGAHGNAGIGFLNLPRPKNTAFTKQLNEEIVETLTPVLAKLPMPKANAAKELIVEEDDEFLHKKPIVLAETPKPPAPVAPVRVPVKITIPSMKDFSDVDEELAKTGKNKALPGPNTKRSGLLTILPQAKSEQNFAKAAKQQTPETLPAVSTAATTSSQPLKSNPLIPDTVRNRRPAHNTEGVDGIQIASKLKKGGVKQKPQVSLVQCSDSEASDDEPGDFFSLNDEEKLPEVNANEISVMVAKRAAKMAETTTKFLETSNAPQPASQAESQHDAEDMRQAKKRYHESQLDEAALQALVGSNSKRRRQQRNEIEIVDISSHQVMPDREEWMRSALASQTTYQPTGVLVDEEPAAGTRRKHQITYLAHKAKANEAELQAMWSANRQNRRATQSKYGF